MSIPYHIFFEQDICMGHHNSVLDKSTPFQTVLAECKRLGSMGAVQVSSGNGQWYILPIDWDYDTVMVHIRSGRGTHPDGTHYTTYIRRKV